MDRILLLIDNPYIFCDKVEENFAKTSKSCLLFALCAESYHKYFKYLKILS